VALFEESCGMESQLDEFLVLHHYGHNDESYSFSKQIEIPYNIHSSCPGQMETSFLNKIQKLYSEKTRKKILLIYGKISR
jgi:hypothetical protein